MSKKKKPRGKIIGLGNQRKGLKPKVKTITVDPNEIRILMHCDYNCNTGFGNVARHFIEELRKDKNYTIIIHGINDFSKNVYKVDDKMLVKPTYLNPKGDPYGRIDVLNALYQTDFDIFFMLNDVEVISQMMEHICNVRREKKKEGRPSFKMVTYSPIDSHVRKFDLKGFQYIDEIITYTEYAKNHMEELDPKLKGKVRILPHGVNKEAFYKIEDKDMLKRKRKLFGKNNEDAFVFGSVNRNQVRKDIGALLLGFQKFKQQFPKRKAIMYLHCNPEDKSGINLFRACERLGLDYGKDIFFPKEFSENKGLDISDLNEIYNTFDVFITTTTAEGWGLTVTEAMATETPIIAPINTALYEVTGKGKLVEPLKEAHQAIFVEDFEKIRSIVDPAEVCNAMERLYNAVTDPLSVSGQMIINRTAKALKHVQKLNWDEISADFKNIVDSLK